jgi:hypothetical protein
MMMLMAGGKYSEFSTTKYSNLMEITFLAFRRLVAFPFSGKKGLTLFIQRFHSFVALS